MLEYLVTSQTRRSLLRLLWSEALEGSVSELAKAAGVAFAGAHRELHAMEEAGLAEMKWEKGHRVFRMAMDYPHKELLKELLETDKTSRDRPEELSADQAEAKSALASLGLPVSTGKSSKSCNQNLETLLAQACVLAHHDPSVTRALPVLLAKYKDALDMTALESACRKMGEKHTMGFFLDLTGELSDDERLSKLANLFQDHRRKKPRQFFAHPTTFSRRVAARKTPELAKKWGWLMNMSLESFSSTFDKFRDDSIPVY